MYYFDFKDHTLCTIMSVCTLAVASLLLTGCGHLEQKSFGAPRENKSASADSWETTKSEEGSFSASMPGRPTKTTQTVQTVAGKIDLHMYIVERNLGRIAFFVGFSDLPAVGNMDGVLTGCVDGVVKSVNGTIETQYDIKVAGYPGRHITFHGTAAGQALVGHTRVLLVDNRLYQLLVLGLPNEIQQPDVERFFESFQPL